MASDDTNLSEKMNLYQNTIFFKFQLSLYWVSGSKILYEMKFKNHEIVIFFYLVPLGSMSQRNLDEFHAGDTENNYST